MEGEVTLKQIVESTWFKLASRGAMLVGCGLISYASATIYGLQSAQVQVSSDVAGIQQVQATEKRENDAFKSSVNADLTQINSRVFLVQTDLATVKGILEEMRRRSVADNQFPR